jgi:hypothetical protein
MWVKGALLHFIIDSSSQKNLISAKVIKRLDLPTTLHLQPYTIDWLHQGRDIFVNLQCRFPYDIKPFNDEVLCDISPLEVCDFLLGKPYFCGSVMLCTSLDAGKETNLEKYMLRFETSIERTL